MTCMLMFEYSCKFQQYPIRFSLALVTQVWSMDWLSVLLRSRSLLSVCSSICFLSDIYISLEYIISLKMINFFSECIFLYVAVTLLTTYLSSFSSSYKRNPLWNNFSSKGLTKSLNVDVFWSHNYKYFMCFT